MNKTKLLLITILLLSSNLPFVWADAAPLYNQIQESTRIIFDSIEKVNYSDERQNEVVEYKKLFDDFSADNIEKPTAEYDSEGRLIKINFAKDDVAYYSYEYIDEKLASVKVEYKDLTLKLNVESGEFNIVANDVNGVLEEASQQGFLLKEDRAIYQKYMVNGYITNNSGINFTNMPLNFPALQSLFDDFNSTLNNFFSQWDTEIESDYYSPLASVLKKDLEFWLSNLNKSNLQEINSLDKTGKRNAIDEAARSIISKSQNRSSLSGEYENFITVEQYLRYKLLVNFDGKTLLLEELLEEFYRDIEKLLIEQNIPVIVESEDDINILIALPELPEFKSETEKEE